MHHVLFKLAGRWAVCLVGVSVAGVLHASESDAVVSAVRAANPDMKALCQKGPDAVRQATMAVLMSMASQGQIKGNPQAVGTEAGQKLGRECRGG